MKIQKNMKDWLMMGITFLLGYFNYAGVQIITNSDLINEHKLFSQ